MRIKHMFFSGGTGELWIGQSWNDVTKFRRQANRNNLAYLEKCLLVTAWVQQFIEEFKRDVNISADSLSISKKSPLRNRLLILGRKQVKFMEIENLQNQRTGAWWRLELDKRQDRRAFCVCFKTLEEAPKEFYELQDKIRNGLQREFCWTLTMEQSICVGSRGIQINSFQYRYVWFGALVVWYESRRFLRDKLIGLIMSYLEKFPSPLLCGWNSFGNMERGSELLADLSSILMKLPLKNRLLILWSKQ